MTTLQEILEGLPTDAKDYNSEQLGTLFSRYSANLETLPSDVVEAVKAIGIAATERLNAEKSQAIVAKPEQPYTKKPGSSRNGKPGVLKAIEEMIRAEPLTKEEVVERLAAKFPTRDKSKMATSARAMLQGGFVRKGLKCTYATVDGKCVYKIED